MPGPIRSLRSTLTVLLLALALAVAPATPRSLAWAGSCAQRGEIDVGSAPAMVVPAWAGTYAQPGELDPG